MLKKSRTLKQQPFGIGLNIHIYNLHNNSLHVFRYNEDALYDKISENSFSPSILSPLELFQNKNVTNIDNSNLINHYLLWLAYLLSNEY